MDIASFGYRENYQTVIGTAFEDLDALMTSAKEVIAMAEEFRKQMDSLITSVRVRNSILNYMFQKFGTMILINYVKR